jgi:DNA repair protein RecO (recombination protein O)
MARRVTLEAIVLKTIDVGEADRLCVLFTREDGRKAARAKSVRKTASRLGGTILPFRHIAVELSETDNHTTITGASDKGDLPEVTSNFSVFLQLQQGTELLLSLTENDEPIPGVFDLLFQFIRLSAERGDLLLPFQLRLLHLLGFLPENDDDARFNALSKEAQAYIRACAKIGDLSFLADMQLVQDELQRFMKIISSEQLERPLKSVGM